MPTAFKQKAERTIPVEDIGVLLLDHRQITITHALLAALLDNNCAVITCDDSHLPTGLMLPLCGNATQSERFRDQIEASLPLRKQLWQQTVQAKIANQAALLHRLGVENRNMLKWVNEVRSGDTDNMEARAAVYYWDNLFPAQLRLRHSARRRGPGSRNQRAAAHVGHSPPQPLQRLLPRRRHHGTVPSLRRPYGV